MSILGLFMIPMGCTLPDLHHHSYVDYLNESIGHADHDAVARNMGAPYRRTTLDQGGDVWTYRQCLPRTYGDASANGIVSTVSGGYCQYIELVFDGYGKLIRWQDQKFAPYTN
jgi:hypothetical protein